MIQSVMVKNTSALQNLMLTLSWKITSKSVTRLGQDTIDIAYTHIREEMMVSVDVSFFF